MADWFWAARNDEPACNAFVIADGKDALWSRVRLEINRNERCAFMPVHQGSTEPTIGDILDMMLTVVPMYRVNHNRFVLEAVQIPVFAKFIRNSRSDLPNYVSNSMFREALMPIEPYSDKRRDELGEAVSSTLGIDDEWFR